MAEISKRHTLVIDGNKKVSISGVESVNSIFDKEVEVALSDRRLVIKGSGLNASKLNVEEGTLSIEGEEISSVNYYANSQKLSLKRLFNNVQVRGADLHIRRFRILRRGDGAVALVESSLLPLRREKMENLRVRRRICGGLCLSAFRVFLFRKRNSAEMVLFFGAWTGIFCLRENSRRAA